MSTVPETNSEPLRVPLSDLLGAWQPIETAPRDGTWFIAARFIEGDEPEYEIGAYDPLRHGRFEPLEDGSPYYLWIEEVVYEWSGFNNMPRMTHWTPIPAPPQRS